MAHAQPPSTLDRGDGHFLAYHAAPGRPSAAGLVWLGGFRSDMEGSKARALDAWARRQRRSCVRFDYYGHGTSSGLFVEGTIGRWRDDALAVIDRLTEGPQVLVGSSMGGWIALLAALARPDRVRGLCLIAPATDMTERLIWPALGKEGQNALMQDGGALLPGGDGFEPAPITRELIEEGRRHVLLDQPSIPFRGPARIIHGMGDQEVPWTTGAITALALEGEDVEAILVKNGDHRLSSQDDLARMLRVVETVCVRVET